jgi:hypothetical protein
MSPIQINAQIQIGMYILRAINNHLAEPNGCRHTIMEIMKEAVNFEAQVGLDVTSIQNQKSSGVQSAGELIDIDINRQTTN